MHRDKSLVGKSKFLNCQTLAGISKNALKRGLFFLYWPVNIVQVFHKDFKTGLNIYSDPFLFLPGEIFKTFAGMKETTFYIVLNIKTGNGFESFGKFFLGNSRDAAYSIFHKLKGSKKLNEKTILHFDFMETKKGLPVNIQVISCSLGELGENCKIITKEIFKLLNLEQI